MSKIEISNGVIGATFLGIEDHGIFTCIVHIDRENYHQGFGTHNLMFSNYGIPYLRRILEVAGVDSWEKLKGRNIRVCASWDKIHGIGHIIKNDWFYPQGDPNQVPIVEADVETVPR